MANFTPKQNEYINMTPFKLAVLKYFPFINTADFDSLTNYGIMCKLGEHLNTIQDNEKFTEENVTNIFNAYNELQNYVNNYFDNLDVQDEINNKLDKMAEDGTISKLLEPLTANIQNNVDGLNNNLKTLTDRVNNLSSIKEGSTTGDAELEDIRIAYDGYKYPTAGDAVRGQIDDVLYQTYSKMTANYEKVTELSNTIIQANMNVRFLANGTTETTSGNVWAISDYIDVTNGITAIGYSLQGRPAIVEYDENKNVVGTINQIDPLPSSPAALSKTYYGSTPKLRYIRVQSQLGYNKPASAFTIKQISMEKYFKEKYVSNYIHFTVNVNTSFNDTASIDVMQCVLHLPDTYSNNVMKPTKLAVYAHGAGGIVNSSTEGELSNADYLLNNGYAILDCAGVPGNQTERGSCQNMGSPIAIEGYYKAIKYVIDNYNVTNTIYLHGASMGGLVALNLANAHPEIIKAISLFYPVTDMYNQAWQHPWWEGTYATRKMIAKYFNFNDQSGSTYEPDKIIGFNPINNKSVTINNVKYSNICAPIKIWHGNADPTVNYEYSKIFINNLKNYGCQAYFEEVDGAVHATTQSMKNGELVWFNRF